MKKKKIQLSKKLLLKKETLTTLTPDQQTQVAGGWAFASRTPDCETQPITGRPFCILCP
ncbi:class I lanthipeptide [Chitinophaga varians]|uniref:class I lanthipeptide n=1 Tax=Chitinophaga varians TaxID=2202339 RepID=UPI00165F1FB0|nr:class I lanthipeptide [Chitinophaga varians]MBC9909742.1 class I lanthipeptide [Chitinophaga varians]